MLSGKDATHLVSKAAVLLQAAQMRRVSFSKSPDSDVTIGAPSHSAVVSWSLIEGEALEVIMTSLCSVLVQVKQRELMYKSAADTISPSESKDMVAIYDTKSALCNGVLLQTVLQALMRHDKQNPHDETTKPQATRKLPVRKGFKTLLMQCVANLCSASRRMQDMVRELGGILVILNCCTSDVSHPMLREWALVAVRHICDGNILNQEFIARLEQVGTGAVKNPDSTSAKLEALKAAGIEARFGEDGRMTLRRTSKKV